MNDISEEYLKGCVQSGIDDNTKMIEIVKVNPFIKEDIKRETIAYYKGLITAYEIVMTMIKNDNTSRI